MNRLPRTILTLSLALTLAPGGALAGLSPRGAPLLKAAMAASRDGIRKCVEREAAV